MGQANYKVVSDGESWSVDHDGGRHGTYTTKEAAFEAIVGAAANAIKAGHEVSIVVPGREAGNKTALG